MNEFTTHPAVYMTGLVLLHFIWQGAVIGFAHSILLARFAAASPFVRYRISLVALILLLLAPVTTLLFYLPGAETTVTNVSSLTVTAQLAASDPNTPAVTTTTAASPMQFWLHWAVIAWLVGVLASALRFTFGFIRLRDILRQSDDSVVPAWLKDELQALKTSLGIRRNVQLAISNLIDSPLVVGWITPTILLPVSATTGLSPEQLRMALTHELAHVLRHDYLVNIVQVLLETILFYHPAVHHVSRSLRREREQCCDDIVAARCSNRIAYARLLAELETIRHEQLALAISGTDSELVLRINRIVGLPVPMPRRHRRINWPFLLPLTLAISLLVLHAMNPDARSDQQVMQSLHLELPPAEIQPLPAPIKAVQADQATATGKPDAQVSRNVGAREEKPGTAAITASSQDSSATEETQATAAPVTTSPAEKKATQETVAANATEITPIEQSVPANDTQPVPANDTSQSATTVAEPEPVDITGGELVKMIEPDYPNYARRNGVEGHVTLRFTVNDKGGVQDIEIVSAEPERIFNDAALEAVRQWRFSPYMANGEPIARERLQLLEFTLPRTHRQQECDTTGTRICRPGIGNLRNR